MRRLSVGVKDVPRYFLVPIADTHIGLNTCDKKQLCLWTGLLAEAAKNVEIVPFLLGDIVDGVTIKDKRFHGEAVDPVILHRTDDLVVAQVELATRLLEPIQKLIRFAVAGNHEVKVSSAGQMHPHKLLCERLDIPDVGYSALVRLRGRTLYVHHGHVTGSRGRKVSRLADLVRTWGTDIVIVGHGHSAVDTCPVFTMEPNSGKIRYGRGIMCPAWLRPVTHEYSPWPETKGFDPSVHGPTLIEVSRKNGVIGVYFGDAAFEVIKRCV